MECTRPKHISVKLLNSKDKEIILYMSNQKKSISYKGEKLKNKLASDLPTAMRNAMLSEDRGRAKDVVPSQDDAKL